MPGPPARVAKCRPDRLAGAQLAGSTSAIIAAEEIRTVLIEHYRAMTRYNRWMNERLFEQAERLGDEPRKRPLGAFFGSLHGTFNHLLLADRIWLARFGACPEPVFTALSDELFADFATLRAERAATDAVLSAYVASLGAEDLERPLAYRTTSGESKRHALWFALSHLFNHQAHHRGQATTLFMQLGCDPGPTDLVPLLRGDL
jgi:uncharacterized damage-inducible protein DinB